MAFSLKSNPRKILYLHVLPPEKLRLHLHNWVKHSLHRPFQTYQPPPNLKYVLLYLTHSHPSKLSKISNYSTHSHSPHLPLSFEGSCHPFVDTRPHKFSLAWRGWPGPPSSSNQRQSGTVILINQTLLPWRNSPLTSRNWPHSLHLCLPFSWDTPPSCHSHHIDSLSIQHVFLCSFLQNLRESLPVRFSITSPLCNNSETIMNSLQSTHFFHL